MQVTQPKRSFTGSRLALAASLVLALAFPHAGDAFVHITGGPGASTEGLTLSWNLDRYPSGIPYVLSTSSTGDGTQDIAGTAEYDSIRQAFQCWTSVPASRVAFQEAGISKTVKGGCLDGINTVCFDTSNSLWARAGVVAVTLPTYRPSGEGVTPGEIAEADVVILDSDLVVWKTTGRNSIPTAAGSPIQVNLLEVASREVGHFIGLDASFVRAPFNSPLFMLQDGIIILDHRFDTFASTALMYPYVLNNSPVQSTTTGYGFLTPDEVAGCTALYPATESNTGSISGTITVKDIDQDTTVPLCGAHVVAALPGANSAVASTLTKADGSYVIEGLPNGSYLVYVEPSSPLDYQSTYETLNESVLNFIPEFFNNGYFASLSRAEQVSVASGVNTGGIDVEVVKSVDTAEVTYALGGLKDENGDPLILKTEPDNSIEVATRLSDDDRDGYIFIDDTIQIIGDHDFYSFRALRDDVYKVTVRAEALGSALDPVLNLYGPGIQATPFSTADNTEGLDPSIIFTVPQTDSYYVEIFNASSTAGTDHFYQLVIERISGRESVTPLGGPVAVLSVPITDASLEAVGFTNPTYGNIEITSFKVQFLDVDGDGGLNTDGSDFLAPSREPNASYGSFVGGFAIFNDNGPVHGEFDYDAISPSTSQDLPITMATVPTITPFGFGFEVTFTPQEPLIIPAERLEVSDATPDFHIVIQPSLTLHHGDDFQVIIPANGITVRANISGSPQQTKLFPQAYPDSAYRNKYTGDIVEFQTYTPDGGGTIGANSIDYPVVGLNLIGDPDEEYWVSEVELTILGYNFHNLRDLGIASNGWDGYVDAFQKPNNIIRLLDLTDFRSLTSGVTSSGGFNLYADNDNLGSANDGVPNFGLEADTLVALNGTQHYEVIDPEDISDDIVLALLPHSMQAHITVDDFLLARNDLNMFAFKVILPVQPQPDRLVPDSDALAKGTLGSDMFVTLRTSNTIDAIDVFLPYVQVDGVHISNNLSEVIKYNDVSRSSLVNGGSMRTIDNCTSPNTDIVEVRPDPYIQFRDMVNSDDSLSSGNVIGTAAEGSPPIAGIGIDAHDYNASACVTFNQGGTTGNIILNTGIVLNSLTVYLDPVESSQVIPNDFVLNVSATSTRDPDLVGISRRGIDIILDDDTIAGDFQDNDNDYVFPMTAATIFNNESLVDEELRNGTDDDLDGITDENDFGDEDAVGINGQYDTNDDTIAYLQANDLDTTGHSSTLVGVPTVTSEPGGSLRVNFSDLATHVLEGRWPEDLIADALTTHLENVFYRVDHPVVTTKYGLPTAEEENLWEVYQIGWFADYGDPPDPPDEHFQPLLDLIHVDADYYYLTEIPNNDSSKFLQGSDFFITARMGNGANVADKFRMRIPANGLGFSSYRGPDAYVEDIRPGNIPVTDFSTSDITVGGDNVAPSLTFVTPNSNNYRAEAVLVDGRIEYEFDVRFVFDDPDNAATVDFYYDTDRTGLNGNPIPVVEGESTTNITDNDGIRPYTFTFRFPEELASQAIAKAYIYAVMSDGVNTPQSLYSAAAIVLDATSRAEATDVTEFLIADNLGQIFGTGGANVNIPEYRQSSNIVRDFELTPNETGALFLNGYGDVVLKGDPEIWEEFVKTSESVTFPEGGSISLGMDIARDIEPDWESARYFVLDGYGGVHCVGAAAPFTLTGLTPAVDDIYRDMELTATGLGLEVMSAFGGIHPLGDGTRFTNVPSFGLDIARDMALSPTGAYLLDAYGGIYNIGLAEEVNSSTSVIMYPGSDVYRSIEYLTGGVGLLVMDRQGQVYKVGDEVLLGPNPVADNLIAMPGDLDVGDPVSFVSPLNVVTGETKGAFIDLEVATAGEISDQLQDTIVTPLDGLCSAITREDLTSMLKYLTTDFLDDQGHGRSDFAAVWKAFFNHYRVLSCTYDKDSLRISESNTAANTYIVSASMTVYTMDPVLRVMAPADDPLAFDGTNNDDPFNAGEIFSVGPIQVDQVARYWETDDGRGWRLRIIDDDYTDAYIDRADNVLDECYFSKTRSKSKHECEGSVYLNEEDQAASGINQNSNYLFQFTEEVEPYVTSSDSGGTTTSKISTGGWFQPVLYLLWFNAGGGDGEATEGGTVPTSIFRVKAEFSVYVDPTTQVSLISGGENAVFSLLSTLSGSLGATDGVSSLDTQIDNPVGWRFFNSLGITVEADRDMVYDSHLTAAEGGSATDTVVLNVPDVSSSAYIINLNDASDAYQIPFGTLPLDEDLDIHDTQGELILPDFSQWARTTTVQPGDYVVITFRADEQGGVTDRLYYAVIHILSVNGPSTNNSYTNLSFTWRYMPATDYIPNFNAYKKK